MPPLDKLTFPSHSPKQNGSVFQGCNEPWNLGGENGGMVQHRKSPTCMENRRQNLRQWTPQLNRILVTYMAVFLPNGLYRLKAPNGNFLFLKVSETVIHMYIYVYVRIYMFETFWKNHFGSKVKGQLIHHQGSSTWSYARQRPPNHQWPQQWWCS